MTNPSSSSSPKSYIHVISGETLPTASVTIYRDNRAAIVRHVPNLRFKPGRNEVIITGITHNALQESIKISGHGTTTGVITDLSVDLVPRPRIPHGCSSASDSESDKEEDENEERIPPNPLLKTTSEALDTLRSEKAVLQEEYDSNQAQAAYLNTYCQAGVHEITGALSAYATTRRQLFTARIQLEKQLDECSSKINTTEWKWAKLNAEDNKKRRAQNERAEERKREKEERRKEKNAVQMGLSNMVYRVKIVVEFELDMEVVQDSIVAKTTTGKPIGKTDEMELDAEDAEKSGPSLTLSYITTGASWVPKYDLRLDTTEREGSLTYRAGFYNSTGETWRDALITLSTSQNTFRGVEDKVPELSVWNIGLAPKTQWYRDDSLLSPAESQRTTKGGHKQVRPTAQAAHVLSANDLNPGSLSMQQSAAIQIAQQQAVARNNMQSNIAQQDYQMQLMLLEQQNKKRLMMARQEQELKSGGYAAPIPQQQMQQMQQQQMQQQQMQQQQPQFLNTDVPVSNSVTTQDNDPYDSDSSEDTIPADSPAKKLRLATTASGSHGTTTTYDLPGVRTVPPSHLHRHHVITEFPLSSVAFYHVSVPKLRQAVFLKARVQNTSTTYLLRGAAGLTLDGSYLGTTSIPRCAPGDSFGLELGVDEQIQIRYSKPIMKVASHGGFMGRNSELVQTFYRRFVVYNKKLDSTPVRLLVIDQLPVSEDEKLKLNMVRPKGVKSEGDKVNIDAVGMPATDGGQKVGTVIMKPAGEVWWELELEKGKQVDAGMEYEARLPEAEVIVQK